MMTEFRDYHAHMTLDGPIVPHLSNARPCRIELVDCFIERVVLLVIIDESVL